jgi:hypothetical protein
MEVAQARKRSIMQKHLKNRLIVRDFAASSTSSSYSSSDISSISDGSDDSDTINTSDGSGSFIFTDDNMASSEDSEAEAEAEELAAPDAIGDTDDGGKSGGKSRKFARSKSRGKTETRAKAKSARKSTKVRMPPMDKCGSKKGMVGSSIKQRQVAAPSEVKNTFKPATLKPAVIAAASVFLNKKKKKKNMPAVSTSSSSLKNVSGNRVSCVTDNAMNCALDVSDNHHDDVSAPLSPQDTGSSLNPVVVAAAGVFLNKSKRKKTKRKKNTTIKMKTIRSSKKSKASVSSPAATLQSTATIVDCFDGHEQSVPRCILGPSIHRRPSTIVELHNLAPATQFADGTNGRNSDNDDNDDNDYNDGSGSTALGRTLGPSIHRRPSTILELHNLAQLTGSK